MHGGLLPFADFFQLTRNHLERLRDEKLYFLEVGGVLVEASVQPCVLLLAVSSLLEVLQTGDLRLKHFT